MERANQDGRNDQGRKVGSGDIIPSKTDQDAIAGDLTQPQDVNILTYPEYEILAFLVRRKQQVTLRQVAANVNGYSERELKSFLVGLAMKDMIKTIEGKGDLKYVLALAGFVAWDDYKR